VTAFARRAVVVLMFALTSAVVETTGAAAGPGSAALRAVLKDLGNAPTVEVGFQYRRKKRTEELYDKGEAWRETHPAPLSDLPRVFGTRPRRPYENVGPTPPTYRSVTGSGHRVPPTSGVGQPAYADVAQRRGSAEIDRQECRTGLRWIRFCRNPGVAAMGRNRQ